MRDFSTLSFVHSQQTNDMGSLLSTSATAVASSSVSNNPTTVPAVPAAANNDPSVVSTGQVMPSSAAWQLGRTTVVVAPSNTGKTVLLREMTQSLLRRLATYNDGKVAVVLVTPAGCDKYNDLMTNTGAAAPSSRITWIQWDSSSPLRSTLESISWADVSHAIVVVDDVPVKEKHVYEGIMLAAFEPRFTLLFASQSLGSVPLGLYNHIEYYCFGRCREEMSGWGLFGTGLALPVPSTENVKVNEFLCVARANPTTSFTIAALPPSTTMLATR